MSKTIPALFVILFSTVSYAQTPQIKERTSVTTAGACKKSSGFNVFIELDARPTTLANGAQKVHLAPAKSLELVSRFEANLKAKGFCVFHNDEFDGTGNHSLGDVAGGAAPQIDIAFLATAISFPESKELLVYSIHFGDWTTTPRLPYYLLDESTDTSALAQELTNTVQAVGKF